MSEKWRPVWAKHPTRAWGTVFVATTRLKWVLRARALRLTFIEQLLPAVLLHTLSDLDNVNLSLRGADLEAVLRELFASLRATDAVEDADQVWSDLISRQAAGPVALDDDIALPHARTSGVRRIAFAAGRHPTGVAFDKAHQKVRLIFLILTPKERPAEYLQLVAALARRFRDPAVRNKLLNTTDAADFSAQLRG